MSQLSQMDRSGLIESPLSGLAGGLGGLNMSAGAVRSPFLNVDPSTLSGPSRLSSEFIYPEGGTKSSRGRLELAFTQIGLSVGIGAGIGGGIGTFKGLREVAKMSEALSVKRTHLLNYITRNGASVGNTFGTLALLYSTLGVGLSFIQDENDELNTVLAATTTGTLYGTVSQAKAMQGLTGSALNKLRLKRAGFGFAGGLVAAATIIMGMNQEFKFRY